MKTHLEQVTHSYPIYFSNKKAKKRIVGLIGFYFWELVKDSSWQMWELKFASIVKFRSTNLFEFFLFFNYHLSPSLYLFSFPYPPLFYGIVVHYPTQKIFLPFMASIKLTWSTRVMLFSRYSLSFVFTNEKLLIFHQVSANY